MHNRDDMAAGVPSPAVSVDQPEAGWTERSDPPLYRVTLWPHRSLTQRGQGTVLRIAAAGFLLPLGASAGTPVFWGLLPFCALALALLWFGFRRSNRDAGLTEELTLWRDEIRVERREPHGRILRWSAPPYWVRLRLYPDGKVENYLTLRGGGREIELGAFLSPWERLELKDELERALAGLH